MSKRAGDFISAQDLLNEVEKDQIRFMMLNRVMMLSWILILIK